MNKVFNSINSGGVLENINYQGDPHRLIELIKLLAGAMSIMIATPTVENRAHTMRNIRNLEDELTLDSGIAFGVVTNTSVIERGTKVWKATLSLLRDLDAGKRATIAHLLGTMGLLESEVDQYRKQHSEGVALNATAAVDEEFKVVVNWAYQAVHGEQLQPSDKPLLETAIALIKECGKRASDLKDSLVTPGEVAPVEFQKPQPASQKETQMTIHSNPAATATPEQAQPGMKIADYMQCRRQLAQAVAAADPGSMIQLIAEMTTKLSITLAGGLDVMAAANAVDTRLVELINDEVNILTFGADVALQQPENVVGALSERSPIPNMIEVFGKAMQPLADVHLPAGVASMAQASMTSPLDDKLTTENLESIQMIVEPEPFYKTRLAKNILIGVGTAAAVGVGVYAFTRSGGSVPVSEVVGG